MKKFVFAFSLFIGLSATIKAQIPNNSFENWALDTFYLAAGQISGIPADTIEFYDPVNWSSSNMLSGLDSLGGVYFVTQSSNAYHGSSSIHFITDTIKLPVIQGFPALTLTLPGFALNGDFPITTNSLIGGGSVISPISIQGAGQPFTQRLSKISGYYDYVPVFNPNKGSNDTCISWATLRQGSTAVADAIFKSTANTGGFQYFEANFEYHNCLTPDTLVVFMASSVPNTTDILNGQSGLVRGSELWVDSITYNETPLNFNFPPIAKADLDSTYKNTAKNFAVKANDEDCNDPVSSLTVAIVSGPSNGTATVSNGEIAYTPAVDFVGIDTVVYSITDGGSLSASALIRILVFDANSIAGNNLIPVTMYPVPASNELFVQFENEGRTTANVYDVVGKLIQQYPLNANVNRLDVSTLVNGIYTIQIINSKQQTLANSKFTVSK